MCLSPLIVRCNSGTAELGNIMAGRTSEAADGEAATTVGEPGSAEGSHYRDRDPPASYDGADPEATFKSCEKSVRLWEFETGVPRNKRGAKLLRSMTGLAKLALEEMSFEDI